MTVRYRTLAINPTHNLVGASIDPQQLEAELNRMSDDGWEFITAVNAKVSLTPGPVILIFRKSAA